MRARLVDEAATGLRRRTDSTGDGPETETLRAAPPPSGRTPADVDSAAKDRVAKDRVAMDRAATDSVFARGEVLAERFVVGPLLGRGGMGQVFEAFDRELGARVALKVIRPEQARHPGAVLRFKKEVRLARRVTHANVCRIFDLFQHHPPSGWGRESRPIFFLTMELLEGESLARRLRRQPGLTAQEALPLVLDMAAALDAAHRAGIVHRDFKCSNVILVDDPERRGQRAVVTDFGLADATRRPAASAGRSLGRPCGTPGYMAPELVRGRPATTASDIYALGVVIQALRTGSRRSGIDHLEPAWQAVIARCRERLPENRFPQAGEAVRALQRSPPRLRRFKRAIAGALLATGLAAAVATPSMLRSVPAKPPAVAASRASLAVLGFTNLSGDPAQDWLSPALVEMLTAELAAGGELRIPANEVLEGVRRGAALDVGSRLPAPVLALARGNLDLDYVVSGSFSPVDTADGSRLRLRVLLHETAAAEAMLRFEVSGEPEQLSDLARRAGGHLRGLLGVAAPSTEQSAAARAGLPARAQAARHYSRGLAHLWQHDYKAAAAALEQARELEDGAARIHAALAASWKGLGYDQRAAAAASRALDRSAGLERGERLQVEALRAETVYDWQRAEEIYHSLWVFFPDSPDHGLALATVQAAGGQPLQAVATVDELRRRFGDAPRFDLAEAEAARARADLERQQQAAQRAAAGFRRLDSELLVARAGLLEAEALRGLGRGEQAAVLLAEVRRIYSRYGDRRNLAEAAVHRLDAFDEQRQELQDALGFFRQVGDKQGIARALVRLAKIRMLGDPQTAASMLEEQLALARQLGHRGLEAEGLNRLATVHYFQSGLDVAVEHSERAVAMARQSGDVRLLAGILSNHASFLGDRLELAAAERALEEGLALSRRVGSRYVMAVNLMKSAFILDLAGRPAAAAERCREMLATGELPDLAYQCRGFADLRRGDLAAALDAFREMSRLRGDAAEPEKPDPLAADHQALALQYLGQPARAEAVVRAALDGAGGDIEDPLNYRLVDVLLDQGRYREAAGVRLPPAAGGAQPTMSRQLTGAVHARLAWFSGQRQRARASLEELIDEARRAGSVHFELEGRFELGRLLLTEGSGEGSAVLEHVARDARAAGLNGLAIRTRRALDGRSPETLG